MARIRSVHPGLFRDELFVQLSDSAQILFVGLGTFADDQGMFPWKPHTIKMELRADSLLPVEPLLAEMEALNLIRKFTVKGREYGAIRNFRKHQRPKTPNSIHPITLEIRIYVALDAPVSEIPVDDARPFPPKEEMPPQMEDVGVGEGVGGNPPKPPKGGERFGEFWSVYPHRGGHPDPEAPARTEFLRALESGCSVDAIVAGAGAYAAAIRADSVEPRYVLTAKKWLRGGCWDGSKPQLRPDAPPQLAEHYGLRRALDRFRESGFWMAEVFGPKPGEPGCRIPRDLLVEKVA